MYLTSRRILFCIGSTFFETDMNDIPVKDIPAESFNPVAPGAHFSVTSTSTNGMSVVPGPFISDIRPGIRIKVANEAMASGSVLYDREETIRVPPPPKPRGCCDCFCCGPPPVHDPPMTDVHLHQKTIPVRPLRPTTHAP